LDSRCNDATLKPNGGAIPPESAAHPLAYSLTQNLLFILKNSHIGVSLSAQKDIAKCCNQFLNESATGTSPQVQDARLPTDLPRKEGDENLCRICGHSLNQASPEACSALHGRAAFQAKEKSLGEIGWIAFKIPESSNHWETVHPNTKHVFEVISQAVATEALLRAGVEDLKKQLAERDELIEILSSFLLSISRTGSRSEINEFLKQSFAALESHRRGR